MRRHGRRDDDFNPRAPCGARLGKTVGGVTYYNISIHAPRVGRDVNTSTTAVDGEIFQSTRPVWGATIIVPIDNVLGDISIHAPRVGRDSRSAREIRSLTLFQSTRPVWGATRMSLSSSGIFCAFQSTRPVWGATYNDGVTADKEIISIHAPRVGRDSCLHIIARGKLISIHAPRVGRDQSERVRRGGRTHFNPRAPCGARRSSHTHKHTPCHNFNPRAPCGARP